MIREIKKICCCFLSFTMVSDANMSLDMIQLSFCCSFFSFFVSFPICTPISTSKIDILLENNISIFRFYITSCRLIKIILSLQFTWNKIYNIPLWRFIFQFLLGYHCVFQLKFSTQLICFHIDNENCSFHSMQSNKYCEKIILNLIGDINHFIFSAFFLFARALSNCHYVFIINKTDREL